ncbi:rhodanese-like domain-containing protein 4A, chloroplastic [Herrania umbratica]|uniref:Rhodanese-like domain-containing protein 4A, chloroplastic n=1 Tax=Herrania umbratica TaxID=108875 RepID=A0A6J0ZG17_9ROSI|nr:rhodanese-like domain-containing protein 4A, chloroplastic [Herrania umbratica]
MESVSVIHSSSPPFRNHPKTHKPTSSKSNPFFPSSFPISTCIPQTPINQQTNFFTNKLTSPSPFTHSRNHLQSPLWILKNSSVLQSLTQTHLSFTLFNLLTSFPCLASETVISSTEPGKVSLEAILVSIDEFFNENPFFVAGCTFIWLVAVPLTKEYLSKCKFISAIDAFGKLRDDSNAQLLDIRDDKTLASLASPNLKLLNKDSVQVQFTSEDENGFVEKVLQKFPNPANTVLCLLDNFDGNSLKAAELLYQNGFKEAYAIRGGVRGKKGWLAIQETLLPPSVHIKPKKKKKKVKISQQFGVNGAVGQVEDKKEDSSSTSAPVVESQTIDHEVTESMPHAKVGSWSSSPYPNYPDLKPPSSPTPSRP